MTSRGKETKELILANTEALVLDRGFAGTSIDEILKLTGLTKGAFFYHFKSKAALARALVERYWQQDYAMLEELSRRADELSEDPLQSMLIFLKLFEEFIEGLDEPPSGCLFASYVYELYQFDEGVKQFIAEGFKQWGQLYEQRIEKIAAQYPPKITIEASELAETLMCTIEGGFILSKSLCDPTLTARTVRQFRRHLQLLFEA